MVIKIGNLKFPPDPEEMERVIAEDYARFSGKIGKQIEHAGKVVETQHAIIQYIEAMAQILAEAGRASHKALGDSPHYAIDKWCDLMRDKAHQLVGPSPRLKNLLGKPTDENA